MISHLFIKVHTGLILRDYLLKGMAGFRGMPSSKSVFTCAVVLFGVCVLSLLNNFHSVVNIQLVPDITYFYRNQIPYRDDNVTATKFWKRIDAMITNDSLYQEDSDVPLVMNVLRHAKIVKADLFLQRNSYKWNLYMQGGQRIVFKPKLVDASYRLQHCNEGCEHPQYEIAGFNINRLLGFRNFPFTSGRILSWTQDILPVATTRLKEQMNITQDGDVCFTSQCVHENETSIRCFKNGNIPGAMIYFLDKKIYFRHEEGRGQHHEFDAGSKLFRPYKFNPPGDDTYCRTFRNLSDYKKPRDFGDFLDATVISYITDHRDQKITVIRDHSIALTVMFDFGSAFCPHYTVYLAAPIYQCCLIRKATYKRLRDLATSLPSRFEEQTRDDPLYPLLQPGQILNVTERIQMLLNFTNFCIELKGYKNVVRNFL